jgi:hypothetical protein
MPYIGNPIYQSAFVTDTFSGNGSTTAFTMSVAPAGVTNVLVAVSGVLQDPSTYGVVGNTITFSAAPPSGTGNISCRYLGVPVTGVTTTAYRTVTEFTATAGQTTFTPPSYTVGFINVYRNGVLLGSADYTATNGTTVVLTTGATSGDLVTVESFLVSSVLNAIPATAGSVGTTYLTDSSVTQAKLATGVAGTGPAFSAYQSSAQTIASATLTKVQFQTERFDTANAFDSTTNYRFQPLVAGYYLITSGAGFNRANNNEGIYVSIYKNGASYATVGTNASSNTFAIANVNALVYLNGSTDYVETYVANFVGGSVPLLTTAFALGDTTYMSGSLVRAA